MELLKKKASTTVRDATDSLRTSSSFLRRHLVAWLCFVILYYVPVVLYGLDTAIDDDRVSQLLDELVSRTPAQQALILNLATQLGLVTLCYSLLTWMAGQLARISGVRFALLRTLAMVLGWLLLISGNAALFPKSVYTFSFPFLAQPNLAIALAAVAAGCCALIIARTRALRILLLGIGAATVAVTVLGEAMPVAQSSAKSTERNVIIIGVDSLSHHAFHELKQSLPTLNLLLSSGTEYQRAYTPVGRTFPAWMSILSGEQPADHGAIFNLRNMDKVEKDNLLSAVMHESGYRTIFALDERRFNNIDTQFGFSEIVGPTAGALDFVLQQVNDTPLTNLLLQFNLAQRLLPFSYTNTASAANYDAAGFVENVLHATDGAGRVFLAAHFESAHFPFETRHAKQSFHTDNQFWNKHAAALTVVDGQIAQLLEGLKRLGYLDQALVITLSDHGEGLGEVEAEITLNQDPKSIQNYGHGTSVLSDHQNHIILGVTEFRDGHPVSVAAQNKEQVSLMDVRPLIEKYVNHGATKIIPGSECIFVETDLRFAAAADYRTLDPAALAANTARFYEIDDQGRLRLREDTLTELTNTKDIGWRCADRVTFFSDAQSRYFSMALSDRGLPYAEMPLNEHDVEKIKAYRQRLLATIKQQNL